MDPAANQQAFVQAAAQIIPVLVLALLVDPFTRNAQGKGRTSSSRGVLAGLGAGIIGEAVALAAVALGTTFIANVFIVVCMGVITYVILRPHFNEHFGTVIETVPEVVRQSTEGIAIGLMISGLGVFLVTTTEGPLWLIALMGGTLIVTGLSAIFFTLRGARALRTSEVLAEEDAAPSPGPSHSAPSLPHHGVGDDRE
jgi:hypothetical protein